MVAGSTLYSHPTLCTFRIPLCDLRRFYGSVLCFEGVFQLGVVLCHQLQSLFNDSRQTLCDRIRVEPLRDVYGKRQGRESAYGISRPRLCPKDLARKFAFDLCRSLPRLPVQIDRLTLFREGFCQKDSITLTFLVLVCDVERPLAVRKVDLTSVGLGNDEADGVGVVLATNHQSSEITLVESFAMEMNLLHIPSLPTQQAKVFSQIIISIDPHLDRHVHLYPA